MANTYSQLYIQLVFAVANRKALIKEEFRPRLQQYMTNTLQNKGNKMLAIYCMPDHAHVFFGLDPKQAISDLTRDLKKSSTEFVKKNKLTRFKFNWQEGYGCFSYGRSQLDRVVKYVNNQPYHHRKKSFKQEYLEFLRKFEIEYDERYLFDWILEDWAVLWCTYGAPMPSSLIATNLLLLTEQGAMIPNSLAKCSSKTP